jgi:predicted glycogen debranching enzyme
MTISFNSDILQDWDEVHRREWLVTNGIGGYAAGTLSGANFRRYHALLVSGDPQTLQRTVTFAHVDAIARYQNRTYDLSTLFFRDGSVQPMGFRHLSGFRLEGTTPVWTWNFADVEIEQWVVLAWERNTVYVAFRVLKAGASVTIRFRLLHTVRAHHNETHHNWTPEVTDMSGYYKIAREDEGHFFIRWDAPDSWEPEAAWLKGVYHPEEQHRGLPEVESLFQFGDLRVTLRQGDEWQVTATTEKDPRTELHRRWDTVLKKRLERESKLWQSAAPHLGEDAPSWIRQLVLAADQFIVTVKRGESLKTILAGYPWFTDWGRDTMIALPGLCLATGRYEDAKAILRTFARYVDQGMLPNRFPEANEMPEYNTADATLWFFEAVGRTWQATNDDNFLAELLPVLESIIAWHQKGTRYNIHVDSDGLLIAGTAGTQLTWMDVKIGEEVPTPRHGKAVELSALWYNALCWIGRFGKSQYQSVADQTRHSFARFWNPDTGYLFDVLERDGENDPALRPNQLFALSLTHPVLTDSEQARSIVYACRAHLLTPVGLRSLSPDHPQYRPEHAGPPENFDRAYHNGTVWGWLIGTYCRALRFIGASRAEILEPVAGMERHLLDEAVGTLSEIFDGDPPHEPRGCFAQAWTVAEVLAIYHETR